jgi:hypothetical protein
LSALHWREVFSAEKGQCGKKKEKGQKEPLPGEGKKKRYQSKGTLLHEGGSLI